MSYVTDVVFVTASQGDADRFVAIIRDEYDDDLEVKPVDASFERDPSQTIVFNLALNWADSLVGALQTETWQTECVLWTKTHFNEPSVDHFGPPPPPPRRRQHYATDELGDLEQQAIAAGIITPLKEQP